MLSRRAGAVIVALCLVATACSSGGEVSDAGAEAPDSSAADTAPADTAPATSVAVLDEATDTTEPVAGEITVDQLQTDLQATLDAWEIGAEGGGIAFVRNASGASAVAASGIQPVDDVALQPDDRVRVGSISKTVTATLILQLVDEGAVDLDALASTYLPDLGLGVDPTIAQLLSHRSGIPDYTQTQTFGFVVFANPDSQPAPSDMLSYVGDSIDFEPDTRFAYSNTNYIVAGMLVEAVTGQTLAEALAERITGPLGLTSMQFADGTSTDVAGGFSAMMPSGNSVDQSYNSIAYGSWAAGGLVTNVEDLAGFFDALLFGDLVSEESLAAMLEPVSSADRYGLGIHGGDDFGVGHGGSIVGFNSIAQVDLQTQEAIIVVVNSDSRAPGVISRKLADLLQDES